MFFMARMVERFLPAARRLRRRLWTVHPSPVKPLCVVIPLTATNASASFPVASNRCTRPPITEWFSATTTSPTVPITAPQEGEVLAFDAKFVSAISALPFNTFISARVIIATGSLVLYLTFVFVQTVRHRSYFLPTKEVRASYDSEAASMRERSSS